MPETSAPDIERDIAALFDDHFAVVILDSDHTTFDEVEQACIRLFGYTSEEAAALAMRVHLRGAAVAAVLGRSEAEDAVTELRRGNVRSRMEKV